MSSYNQQQSLRFTQLIEDYSPVQRRRANTSIRASFPTFFASQVQTNIVSMHESQKIINENFNKINHIIDLVDDHIRRRIECYQNQVVNVVKKQIQDMREQTEKVVTQFNNMILQKNKENQIWSLNNQLDYFKSEAKKLFDLNKQCKKQNSQLKKKNQQYQWELENREVIMQKLWYKYQKEKFNKEKLKSKMNSELQNIQKQATDKRKLSYPEIMQFCIKEDAFQTQSMAELKLDLIKPIKCSDKSQSKMESRVKIQISQSQVNQPQQQDNSLLIIDIDDESCQQSKIQFKGKSIDLSKPELKDQQSQVNIYLSEHSYKSLFEKKSLKILQKLSREIAIQTEQITIPQNIRKVDNQTTNNSSHKFKSINLIKHGFSVHEAPTYKTHYRSSSSQFNSKQRQTSNHFRQNKHKKERIHTQNNFNKSTNSDFEIQLLTPKPQKAKGKIFQKMSHKFQRSKIIERAYEKQGLNDSFQK